MNASSPVDGSSAPEALLSLSRELLGVAGFDGRIQEANPAWERTLGFTLGELRRFPLLDLLHPDDREAARAAFEQIVLTEGGGASLTNRCRCWDGSYKSLSGRVTASPEKRLYYLAAADITPQRALHVELQKSQKMTQIGLVVGVAHDFNNVLSVIHGCAVMLGASPPLAGRKNRDIEDIVDATQRAAEFVKILIGLCRDRKDLPASGADIGEVVARMERLLRRALGRDIRLDVAVATDLGRIRLSDCKLEQILLNLAVNARDAMRSGGRIELKASRSAGFARLAVSDTGIGMTPEVQARMFEPFFSTKDGKQAAGLGLATVRDIVHDCHGRIEVRSVPGAGTTFEVFLPFVEE